MDTRLGQQHAPQHWPTSPLAYIEWYSSIPSQPSVPNGNMYLIKKIEPSTGTQAQSSIIPVSNIRQSCMLFPVFPKLAPIAKDWRSENILDKCSSFLINNWSSKYAYQTIW